MTFDGIAKLCAQAMGKNDYEIVHYDPKEYDLGKRKAFPLRDQHFFASIEKAKKDLNWAPEFDLLSGLTDSYEKDFKGLGKDKKEPDFEVDDIILGKQKATA